MQQPEAMIPRSVDKPRGCGSRVSFRPREPLDQQPVKQARGVVGGEDQRSPLPSENPVRVHDLDLPPAAEVQAEEHPHADAVVEAPVQEPLQRREARPSAQVQSLGRVNADLVGG